MCVKMSKFTLLFVFSVLLALSLENNSPNNGVIIQNLGKLHYVEGVLLVRTKVQLVDILNKSVAHIQICLANIIRSFTSEGTNKYKLTYLQLERMEKEMKNNILLFAQLLRHIHPHVLHDSLNITNITVYVQSLLHHFSKFPSRIKLAHPIDHDAQNATISKATISIDHILFSRFQSDHSYASNTTPKPKSRRKRGLINLVGYVNNFLWGQATQSQIDEIHENTDTVKFSVNQLNVKTTHLEHEIEHTLKYLRDTIKMLENSLSNSEYQMTMLHIIEDISSTLKTLLNFAIETENRIALVNNQMISLITHQQMVQVISEGEKLFNLQFPFDMKNFMNNSYYKYNNVLRTFATQSPDTFLIAVPFVSIKEPYSLYSLDAFPTQNTYKKFITPVVKKYIARSAHDMTLTDNLDSCARLQQIYLCDNQIEKLSHRNSCEIALIDNNTQQIRLHCKYIPISLPKNYYAVKMPESWFIYFVEKTQGLISCPNKRNSKIEIFHLLNKLMAPCNLRTSKVTFSTTQTKNFNVTQTPAFTIPIVPLNISVTQHETSHALLLNNINHELALLAEEPNIPLLDTHWSIHMPLISTATTCFLLVILAIVGYCFYKKRCSPIIDSGIQLHNITTDTNLHGKVLAMEAILSNLTRTNQTSGIYPKLN